MNNEKVPLMVFFSTPSSFSHNPVYNEVAERKVISLLSLKRSAIRVTYSLLFSYFFLKRCLLIPGANLIRI